MSVNLDFQETEDFLTIKEFADIFKVSTTFVHERIKRSEIPVVHIGDVIRIPSSFVKLERKTHVERLNDLLKPELRELHKILYEFQDKLDKLEKKVFKPGEVDK